MDDCYHKNVVEYTGCPILISISDLKRTVRKCAAGREREEENDASAEERVGHLLRGWAGSRFGKRNHRTTCTYVNAPDP